MLGQILSRLLNGLIDPILDPILEWRHRDLPQDLIWESRPLGSHETLKIGDPKHPILITLNREPKTPDRLVYHDLDRLIIHLRKVQKEQTQR